MPDSGPLTQEQGLALLKRTSDQGWLQSELSGPDGTAAINARLAIWEAVSQSFQAQADACCIASAQDAHPGVCTLTLTRRTGADTYIDLPAGYPFKTLEGIDLILTEPTTILPGSNPQQIELTLNTIRKTELVNTYVPAFDTLLAAGALMLTGPAAVDIKDYTVGVGGAKTYVHVVLGPNATDDAYALRYSSSTLITNATSDWLGAHGNERGLRRQSGETSGEYRARIRLFPDAVSPIAVSTGVHAAASNAGLPDVYCLETISPEATPALLTDYSLSFADSFFADSVQDFYDDPIGVDNPLKYPWRHLEMLSAREARAYFRLALNGKLKEPDGAVPYYDDGYCDDSSWGYPTEGLALRQLSALLTTYSTADRLRAYGVLFDLFVEDWEMAPASGVALGSSSNVLSTVVWTLLSDPLATPGSETTAWLLRDALLSHITDAFGRLDVAGIANINGSSGTWSDGFTAQAGVSTWQSKLAPGFYLTLKLAADPFVRHIANGERFLIWDSGFTADYKKHAGIYEMVDDGDGVRQFVIRRVADANTSSNLITGMWTRITGSGSLNEGKVFTVTTAGTITVDTTQIDFAMSDEPAAGSPPSDDGIITHALRFTFSDGTQFNTALYSKHGSEHLNIMKLLSLGYPFKPVVKIEGYVQSNGTTNVQLAGSFWVVNYTL